MSKLAAALKAYERAEAASKQADINLRAAMGTAGEKQAREARRQAGIKLSKAREKADLLSGAQMPGRYYLRLGEREI